MLAGLKTWKANCPLWNQTHKLGLHVFQRRALFFSGCSSALGKMLSIRTFVQVVAFSGAWSNSDLTLYFISIQTAASHRMDYSTVLPVPTEKLIKTSKVLKEAHGCKWSCCTPALLDIHDLGHQAIDQVSPTPWPFSFPLDMCCGCKTQVGTPDPRIASRLTTSWHPSWF